MEDSDHTPTQPRFELDKDLGDLTSDELLEIEGVLEDSKPIENELGAKLYNAYIRETMTVSNLYPALGPADSDIMDAATRPLYSARLWRKKREEELEEEELPYCDICDMEFESEDELTDHNAEEHADEEDR